MPARNTYVKTASGWEQIATTIQAIPQGLVPIVPTSVTNGSTTGDGQVSFTATTSVSLNGVFSATYDSYLVLLDITTASAATAVNLRLRANGTDNSTASSYLTALVGTSTGGAAVNIAGAVAQSTFTYLATNYALGYGEFVLTDPFAAAPTKIVARTSGTDSGYTTYSGRSGTIGHNVSASYDGLTFYGTSNITGTIRVYGYSKGNLTQPQTIQPYSMAAGSVSITGTGTTFATATVTFPVGRFTVAPIVSVSAASTATAFFASFQSQTATGFTARISLSTGTFTTTQAVNWQATQMTSSTAAG